MNEFNFPDSVLDTMIVKEVNNNRRIHLNEGFDSDSIFKIEYWMNKIKEMDDTEGIPMKDRPPITIVVNSYGGDAYELFGLLGMIDSFKKDGYKIITRTTGKAMSCGLALATAGTIRECYKYSTFLYHQGSSMLGGKVDVMKNDLKEIERLNDIYINYLIEHTKITKEMFEQNKNIDWFLSAEEALELGIVDKIL